MARLFEEHRLKLLGMVQRYLGGRLASRIDAEGVLHDAFLRARTRWIANPSGQAISLSWVYGQVRDQLVEQIRRELGPTRDLKKELPLPEGSVAELILGLARSQTGPSTHADRGERQELVRQALNQLKFRDFEVVNLRIFSDLTFGQIAEVLGEPENTVARRYRRALLKLTRLLPDVDVLFPRESAP